MKKQEGCIVIPYRDRARHLERFIEHYKNRIELDVYVIEQADDKPFNRAKLLNIGYLLAGKEYIYTAFHDVDMLCLTGDYTYPQQPTHLATQCSQFNYRMPYPEYFGGVVLVNNVHFEAVNGYSNNFWGWGAEDDDFRRRFIAKGIPIESRKCRYKSLAHERPVDWKQLDENRKILAKAIDWKDGLSSCEYELISTDKMKDYTLIKVEL